MEFKPGHIYILRNSALRYGIAKIGKTKRNSETRAKEISVSTGVPVGYEVLYEENVVDKDLAEKLIHEHLNEYRINPKREFFELELKDAVKIVFHICNDINEKYLKEKVHRVILFVNSSNTEGLVNNLKSSLESIPKGDCEVWLCYQHKEAEAIIALGKEWHIEPNENIFHDLKLINGIENIEVYH